MYGEAREQAAFKAHGLFFSTANPLWRQGRQKRKAGGGDSD
jgi:hypothetical protein